MSSRGGREKGRSDRGLRGEGGYKGSQLCNRAVGDTCQTIQEEGAGEVKAAARCWAYNAGGAGYHGGLTACVAGDLA